MISSMRVRRLVASMDDELYPGFGDNWDDELFRRHVLANVDSSDHVLDLGAGAGIVAQMDFRDAVRRVCGVDRDSRILENPLLHEAKLGDAANIPYGDASFDIVISSNVLEHLQAPEGVFVEVARVLRAGGLFLAKTPNKWHYVPVIARLTPHALHERVNSWRGRKKRDTFPTHYRINTGRRIQQCAMHAGLEVSAVEHVEGRPEYLRFHPLTYLVGYAYERLVNYTEMLRCFRLVLIATLKKPDAKSRPSP